MKNITIKYKLILFGYSYIFPYKFRLFYNNITKQLRKVIYGGNSGIGSTPKLYWYEMKSTCMNAGYEDPEGKCWCFLLRKNCTDHILGDFKYTSCKYVKHQLNKKNLK